jgi:hypothetical protein
VGKAYKKLIKDWREVLPASSMCLAVPIVPPSQSKRSYPYAQQAAAAETNAAEVSQPANPDGA